VETSDESTTTAFATPDPTKSKANALQSSGKMLSVQNPFSPARTSFIEQTDVAAEN